ncbi:MAG: YidC/Oxa1 family membrane protein insertase [Candidatus Eremiobacterota bacterium]
MIDWIANLMVQTLKSLHDLTGNYGAAVVLFAVFIKILLYPLTHKSYQSMKDMQRVQPEMDKLQKKYAKSDPEKYQQEVTALFRKHKVNPLSGCLPLLLQMPILFAIWKAITHAPELFEQAYFLWIHPGPLQNLYPKLFASSLAGADLPMLLFYALTMYLSQKLTPTQSGAAGQAFLAVFMTLFITYLAWVSKWPCALLLYWSVFTFLTVAQQAFIMRAPDKPLAEATSA